MIHVIFICTGNICRSAMADGYLKYRLKQLGKDSEVVVSSAGTHAIKGETSPSFARQAISRYGANIDKHTSSTLEDVEIGQADFILVMTQRHRRDVIKRYPKIKEKIKLLGEYSKDKEYDEIDDPWGYNLNIYENCAKEIVDSIEGFIQKEL